MPGRTREPPHRIGDEVSVAVRCFGEEYARTRGDRQWASDNVRDKGTVILLAPNKITIDFKDGQPPKEWKRNQVRFKARSNPGQRQRRVIQVDDDQDAENVADAEIEEEYDGTPPDPAIAGKKRQTKTTIVSKKQTK